MNSIITGNKSIYGEILWEGSATYNTIDIDQKFIDHNYKYTIELYNGNNVTVFNHAQDCVCGLKNRTKPHPKWYYDPRTFYYAYMTIPKLYFEYESIDTFLKDFSELDRIVYKITDKSGEDTVVFDTTDKYYFTSCVEDTVINNISNVSEIINNLTIEDIKQVQSIEIDKNSISSGDLSYVKKLIKYLSDSGKTDEENYEYIKNNAKLFIERYVFGYNTRIEHPKEN